MSLKRYIITIFTLTTISLMYVFLQTQIITLGYCVQSKRNLYQQLVDENDSLRYNIKQAESLEILESKITRGKADFELAGANQISMIVIPKELSIAKNNLRQKKSLLNLFGAQREAEARPLK